MKKTLRAICLSSLLSIPMHAPAQSLMSLFTPTTAKISDASFDCNAYMQNTMIPNCKNYTHSTTMCTADRIKKEIQRNKSDIPKFCKIYDRAEPEAVCEVNITAYISHCLK